MKRLLALTSIAATCLAGELPAQEALPVSAGERVRVQSPGVRGVFVVRSIAPDTIVVSDPGSDTKQAVALSTITRLDVSQGRRTRASGFRRGLGFGALAGAALGAIAGYAEGDDSEPCYGVCYASSAGSKAFLGALVMAPIGGLAGGAIGASRRGERWQRVALPQIALGPASSGGFIAAISASF